MANRRRLWLWGSIVALAAVCTTAFFAFRYFGAGAAGRAAPMLSRLPAQNAVIAYVDFAALRRGGFLQMLLGPKMAEDPEYKNFVSQTQFDYRRDLDSALISFHPDGYFFLLHGRFNWRRLETYVQDQGGLYDDALYRMPGSTPARKISFFSAQPDVMALASSPDGFAANRMRKQEAASPVIDIPTSPIWISVPSSVLKTSETLPAGTRMFAKSMEDAENVTISVVPDAGKLAARLDAICRSERDAAVVAGQLQRATAVLRAMMEREKQKPNPADLSGVLTAGVFRNEGRHVIGRWPLERAFLDNLGGAGQ